MVDEIKRGPGRPPKVVDPVKASVAPVVEPVAPKKGVDARGVVEGARREVERIAREGGKAKFVEMDAESLENIRREPEFGDDHTRKWLFGCEIRVVEGVGVLRVK